MRAGRRLAVLAGLLMVSALTSTAAGASSPARQAVGAPPADARARSAHEAAAMAPPVDADPRLLLDAVTDARHPSALLDALRRALLGEAPDDPSEAPLEPAFAAVISGGGHGDLDGDGLADVIVTALGEESGSLSAYRGVDGAPLWTVALTGVDDGFPWGVPDLDGDAIDDLIFVGLEFGAGTWDDTCEPGVPLITTDCTESYTYVFTWRLGIRSGADGRRLWQVEEGGSSTYISRYRRTPMSERREQTIQTHAALTWPSISGDHDGDGLADVVLNVVDDSSRWVESHDDNPLDRRSEDAYEHRTETTARVLRGADGLVVYERHQDDGPWLGWLSPAGVGGDLLWALTPLPSRAERCHGDLFGSSCEVHDSVGSAGFEVIDGTTLAVRWGGSAGAGVYALGDTTGDGMVEIARRGAGAQDVGTQVLAGEDGSLLWQLDEPDVEYLDLMPDLSGDGRPDVLALRSWVENAYDGTSVVAGYEAIRLEGVSGGELFRTGEQVASEEGGDAWAYGSARFDFDGDAVPDLVARLVAVSQSGEVVTRQVVESGRDGRILVRADGDYGTYWSGIADLDGDGADELARWMWGPFDDDRYCDTLEARRLRDEDPLWAVSSCWYGDGRVDATSEAGDQDGRPGQELVRWARQRDDAGRLTTTISSLDGVTLEQRWTREVPTSSS